MKPKTFKVLGAGLFFIISVVSIFLSNLRINEYSDSAPIVSIINSLVAGEVVGFIVMGIFLCIFQMFKNNRKTFILGVSMLFAALLVSLPAYNIQRTRYYHKFGEGGPSGATFDCLGWINYSSPFFEPACSLANIPTLNTALLGSSDSYSYEPGLGYFTSLLFSQLVLLGIPYYFLNTKNKLSLKYFEN
jgi:hypothetical protein